MFAILNGLVHLAIYLAAIYVVVIGALLLLALVLDILQETWESLAADWLDLKRVQRYRWARVRAWWARHA